MFTVSFKIDISATWNFRSAVLFFLIITASIKMQGQPFCFYNPNTGPHYHNGTSGAIYDVCSADFNSDGHLDIVTANSTSPCISFIPGYGNGTLGAADTFPVPATLFCITTADYNSDGKADVAVANHGNIYVLFGNGNGTFQPFSTYAAGNSPSRIYSKDINNDGRPDLLEAAQGGVYVLIAQNGGTFLPAVLYATGGVDIDLTIADFDSDAVADIVSTTHISPTVSVITFMKGNNSGTFNTAQPLFNIVFPDNFIAGITSGDIDNDGKNDIITANSSNTLSRIEVYKGNGNGTFVNPVFYPTLVSPFYIYLADLNNDLVKDVVVEESNGFSVLKGTLNGVFDTFQHFSAMTTPNALALGDFNGDLKTDVIIPSAYFGSPLIAVNLNCNVTALAPGFEESDLVSDLFPNPLITKAKLQFDRTLENIEFNICNIYGQKVRSEIYKTTSEIIIVREGIVAGFYTYQIIHQGKKISVGEFVIAD